MRIPSFNAAGPEYLLRTDARSLKLTLGEYLKENGYSDFFRDHYLLPMTASIWSTPASEMMQFPMLTMFRFCHNHGLLQINGRPQWLTVTNGRWACLTARPWGLGRVISDTVARVLKKNTVGSPAASTLRVR